MKQINLSGSAILALAALGAVAFVIYEIHKNAALFNPTSDKNLAYTGVNNVGSSITGDPNWSLGGWVYDITHGNPVPGP